MTKNHLKRMSAPKTWPIERKGSVFVTRPRPGPHGLDRSVPLSTLLIDVLGVARTARGVRTILNTQEVLVNGKRRRRPEDTAGLMDIVSFPATKASYRITINRLNKLQAVPVAGDDARLLACKVTSKTLLKGGALQVGFHNGRTVRAAKDGYAVGATVLLAADGKEQARFPLEKGAFALITRGRHVGAAGTVERLEDGKAFLKDGGNVLETRKEHVFVLGKGKPAVKIE